MHHVNTASNRSTAIGRPPLDSKWLLHDGAVRGNGYGSCRFRPWYPHRKSKLDDRLIRIGAGRADGIRGFPAHKPRFASVIGHNHAANADGRYKVRTVEIRECVSLHHVRSLHIPERKVRYIELPRPTSVGTDLFNGTSREEAGLTPNGGLVRHTPKMQRQQRHASH